MIAWFLLLTLQLSDLEILVPSTVLWVLGQDGCSLRAGQTEITGDPPGDPGAGNEEKPGSVFLVGGGSISDDLRQHFFELGGGREGNLVIIPGASISGRNDSWNEIADPWLPIGWKQVNVLQPGRVFQENSTIEWQEMLRTADAVWIMGGDQNRLFEVFSSQGWDVESELINLIRRGGVVGGTSAGAAIASKRMIGGGQSIPVLATGWDLLQQTIVDQHFSQRNRLERLTAAVRQFSDCLGVGIDESTALVVSGDRFRILGDGSIHFVQAVSTRSNPPQTFKWSSAAGSSGSWPPTPVGLPVE